MKLPAPFIQLPLLFDADVLAAEILAVPEAFWKPHPQGFAGNSMLPLIAVNGDADNEGFSGPMGPTPHLQNCPYLMQLLDSLGATLGRTRLMRLSGMAEVTRHADQGYYWAERVRVHVPIITQPTVRFLCGDAEVNMAAGECWIFDTWRPHSVFNDDTRERVHLVADTVGGERFWDLVAQGRDHNSPALQSPQRIAPTNAPAPELSCESANVPLVMTPWEMRFLFELLFGDAIPHPQLAVLEPMVRRFCNRWQELWARFGDGPEGRPTYRKTLANFAERFRLVAGPIKLRNELGLASTFGTLIVQVAVTADASDGPQKMDEGMMGMADRA